MRRNTYRVSVEVNLYSFRLQLIDEDKVFFPVKKDEIRSRITFGPLIRTAEGKRSISGLGLQNGRFIETYFKEY